MIAIEMFIMVYIFNVLHRKGYSIIKWVFLVITNAIILPFPFYFIMSPAFYFTTLPSLLIATIINVMVVMIVMPILSKVFNHKEVMN